MGRKYIDETGHRYGRLLVLRIATEEEFPRGAGKPIKWLCKCDCGKLTFAEGRELRNGRRISCGCQSKEKAVELAKKIGHNNAINLTNKRFGKLVALEKSNREEDLLKPWIVWKCKCDCGSITYTRTSYLISGHTTSCGCGRNNFNEGSRGEQYISKIFNKENIVFEREKQFKDLYNGLYRFDFYLPDFNILVEYQGAQHYVYTPHFHKSKSDFLKAQERDRRKIAYCLAQGIKLYEIPYWEVENIKTSEEIFQDRFLVRSKFHNDEVGRAHFSNI